MIWKCFADSSHRWGSLGVGNCGVDLCDSLCTVVSPETQILVEKDATITLPPSAKHNTTSAKHNGGCDCGLFAIAFCTALVHGFHLNKVAFVHQAMWNHLIN